MQAHSGRILTEDGNYVNIADVLGGEKIEGIKENIENYAPFSGRFIAEDGSVVNIALSIGQGGGAGGNETTMQNLIISINGVQQCVYNGETEKALNINMEPLNLNIGGQSYSYNGSSEISINIPQAEGVTF